MLISLSMPFTHNCQIVGLFEIYNPWLYNLQQEYNYTELSAKILGDGT